MKPIVDGVLGYEVLLLVWALSQWVIFTKEQTPVALGFLVVILIFWGIGWVIFGAVKALAWRMGRKGRGKI